MRHNIDFINLLGLPEKVVCVGSHSEVYEVRILASPLKKCMENYF